MKLFEITSTTKMDNGVEFVSGYQGKNMPIYAVQYHPEKSVFSHAEKFNTRNDQ